MKINARAFTVEFKAAEKKQPDSTIQNEIRGISAISRGIVDVSLINIVAARIKSEVLA
jgi:hypothetical protein